MPAADHLPHPLDDEEHSPLSLREPAEIERVLRGLLEARSLISAQLVPGGYACPTALLAVHEDGTLVLDGHRDEAMNQRMAAASRVVCSAQLDLVPIRFRLATPARVVHDQYAAFVTRWPDALLCLQRRQTYRLRCSSTAPVTLYPGSAGQAPDPSTPGLRVLDISGGGVAIAVPDDVRTQFQPPAQVAPCLLRLGDAPPLPVALEVAHATRHQLRGLACWRTGCRFLDMPAAIEQQVMQYIFQIERQRNARLRRGG